MKFMGFLSGGCDWACGHWVEQVRWNTRRVHLLLSAIAALLRLLGRLTPDFVDTHFFRVVLR